MKFYFADYFRVGVGRELHRGSASVAVEPQVLDLLIYLLQNRERVVSKDDLIASVWGGRIVSDATLTSRIYAARKAVGDSGRDQRLIRTIARKGIRFVGPVSTRTMDDERAAPPIVPTLDEVPDRSHPALSLSDRPAIAVI